MVADEASVDACVRPSRRRLLAGAALVAAFVSLPVASASAAILPRTITVATGVSAITFKLTSGTSTPKAAPLTSVNAAWRAAVTGSSWISTDAKQGTATKVGIGTTTKPVSTSYLATFTFPASYSTPTLSITLLADNAATVLLNGTSIGAQKQSDYHPNYQQQWTYSSSTASLFRAGANTLEVRVADYGTATGLDYLATIGYTPPLGNISNVVLSGDPSSAVGIGSIGLDTLPISGLVPQPATGTAGTGVDAITTARITTARITTARITTARITTARITTARITTARITTARITTARITTARIGDPDLISRLLTSTLAQLPLLRPGGWPALLAETTNLKFALPQSTTLANVLADPTPPRELVDPTCAPATSCSPVTLDQFLVAGTPLGDVPWIALLLDGVTWNDITPPTGGWCPELLAAGLPSCGATQLADTILSTVLAGAAIDATSLGVRTFGDIGSTATPLFLSLPIAPLNIAGTFLGDITPAQLTAAGRSPAAVIDCGGVTPCPFANLRDAARAGKILASATWADLGTTTSGAPLVDLVMAYADPSSLPWEQLALGSSHVEQLFPGTAPAAGINFVHDTLSFTLPCGQSATASVTMPAGFAYRPGSSQVSRRGGAATALPDPVLGASLTWAVPALACGSTATNDATVISFQLLPGLAPGSFAGTASVSADGAGAVAGTSAAPVTITPSGSTTATVASNMLVVGQIASPTDIDRYTFSVPAGKTLSVTLSQLHYDADLVLYPPVGAAGAGLLHGTTADVQQIPFGSAPITAGTDGSVLPPSVLQDIPVLPGRDVAGVSSFRGTDPESITTTSVAGSGGDTTYTVQVDGYNGASGPDPYILIVRAADPVPLPGCAPSPTFSSGINAPTGDAMPVVSSSVDTLFLVDRARLRAAFGQTSGDAIVDRLADPATFADPALGVNAAVVPLDAVPAVNAALAAWDAQPCDVVRANAGVKTIDDAVDSLRSVANNGLAHLRNVIVVGDGTIIPHAALPDGTTDTNERDFVGDTIFNGQSTSLTGAAGNGMFQSDAPYGTFNPLSIQGQIVYLPQVALGRLGGDAPTILASIGRFTGSHGLADPNSATSTPRTAFETDYDFFADGGASIRDTFQQQLGATNVSSLFVPPGGAPWTVGQFAAGLLSPTGPAAVIAPNAHFDPARLLAAAGLETRTPSDMYTTGQLQAGAPPDSFALRVVFSIGCHFATDVPDSAAGPTPTAADLARVTDWQQVLQQKGTAVMVGNLGYGVGDTATVGFDEKLMARYAQLLDGNRTAGAGLLQAERDYFRSLSALSPYDLKVLQQVVLWGMPMYRLPTTAPTAAPAGPLAGPIAPDPVSGLDSSTVVVTDAGFHKQVVTDAVTGQQKAFYDAAGVTEGLHPYPIMPKVVVDLPAPAPGEIAHGAVPLDWSQATEPVDAAFAAGGYAFANATVDSGHLEPAPPSPVVYPSSFANIGTSYALAGVPTQQLVVLPAQFRSDPTAPSPAFGTFRRYTRGLWLVTYSRSTTDFTGPAFTNLGTVAQGASTAIAADLTAGPEGVARVLAQALRADGTYWRVELQREGSTNRFGGVLGGTDTNPVREVTYFALDGNGNSSSANNKGPGYVAVPASTATGNGSLSFTPPQPPPAQNGWYTAPPTVGVSGTGYGLRIDNGPVVPSSSTATVGDGAHTVYALDPQGGVVGSAPVFVDTGAPTITGSATPPANGAGWRNGDVTVTYACSDTVSGIATCSQPETLAGEGAALSATGAASDLAGNSSSTTVSPIRIDRTPPGLTGTPRIAPNADGWYRDDVVVDWSATDGLAGVDLASVPPASMIGGEGGALSSAPVTVRDLAGNATTRAFGPVRIDRTAPTVSQAIVNDDGTPRQPSALGWFNSAVRVRTTCADALSGVADCPADVVLTDQGAGQTLTPPDVHDIAGNGTSVPQLGPIAIDSLPPTSTVSSPCSTAGTWCGGSVQLQIDASDQTMGSGVTAIVYRVDGGDTVTVPTAQARLSLTFTGTGQHAIRFHAVDAAGNTELENVVSFNVDSLAPTVNHSVTPMPNGSGWNHADATVHFTGSDDPNGSGIVSVTPATPVTIDPSGNWLWDVLVTGETPGVVVSGSATDAAGNVSNIDSVTVKLDRTPPALTATAAPAGNAAGWNTSAVTVTFSCAPDLLSGLASCPTPVSVTGEGAGQQIKGTASDLAGNETTAAVTLNIDSTPPTLALTGPLDGAVYTLGAVPASGCIASDGLSGLAAPCSTATTGGRPNGVGSFTATATATDRAGNTTTRQASYRVIYRFDGFTAPVGKNGVTAVIRAGLTVPFAFQLKAANGTVVQANADTPPVWLAPERGAALPASSRANALSTTVAPTTGTAWYWDAAHVRYAFDLATTGSQAGSYHRAGVTLDDGQSYTITYGLSRGAASSDDDASDPDDHEHAGH